MAEILTDNWHLYPPPPHPDPLGRSKETLFAGWDVGGGGVTPL